ncbi:unnamed protein product [Ilex paraguariensis]|uniref:Glycosyltransferase n=1 Tax=Ilex paraguariensis TaxID=185542 RepID=A0ABC8RZH5_9AQUA
MSKTKTTPNRHVAVLAFPFASHASLLLGLLRRLATAAPAVIFSFFSTAKSNRSLFSAPTPENIKPYDLSDGVPEGYVFVGRPQEDIDLFLKVAPEEFRKGVAAAESEIARRVSCVVADAFLWFSGVLAEEMGVPWVPLWPSGASSLSIHFYTDFIRDTVGVTSTAGREDEILTFIPGFSELRLGDLPSGVLSGNLESPFSIMLHKMGQILPKAKALLVNSFEELDPPLTKDLKSKFQNFLNIGPFNVISSPPSSNSDDHDLYLWLDKQKPTSVVYISFGTVATLPPPELKALAEALEASGTPFIWSLKDKLKVHLPEGFVERMRENGNIVPWAPQVQILAHSSVGGFISHGGANSVLEAIPAAVPIICRPFFGDQQLNAWMVEKVWKIGLRVEGGVFTKGGIVTALDLVLGQEKGEKLREQIGVFRELALKAVGPNGSSTKNFKTLIEVITTSNL